MTSEIFVALMTFADTGGFFGKNIIYHLVNKKYRNFVNNLVNKRLVSKMVKFVPSQTPNSSP